MFNSKKTKQGFTLTEVLISLLILSLLTAGIVPVVQSATKTYRTSKFLSESTILSDTINSALTDILRYSSSEGEDKFTYEEFKGSSFSVKNGQIVLNTPTASTTQTPLLAKGIYGNMEVDEDTFSLSYLNGVFTVKYTIMYDDLESKDFTASVRSISKK